MPENYQLELRVNKETEEVQGHVIILGQTRKTELKLHARDLKISKILIDQKPVDFTIDSENQLLKINNMGEEQQITVDIRYTFKLSHSMIGMYLSTYKNQGREERIVSTQFESHYARMMFPCIDEPEAKATFDLKIIDTDIEDTILSNMPILSERVLTYTSVSTDLNPKENANALNLNTEVSRKIVIFKTTPKMSTYLLAICIGKFNKISGKNQHGVEVTTYGALNQPAERLEFSNQIAMESLDFYDQLFGIPYPLPKLDQVAIPDFDAGAMENWGLVTYRESCLLVDHNTPQATKEYIATVVTHELSHQWFGNLVTMRWWDNLWLNESFANMMQFYAVDHLRPEWKIWQDYFTEDCLYALRRDSLKNVQSVQQTVSDPAEIDSLFDGAIVYAKGSHLIFMLMRLMTEYNFFQGLKSYFQKFQYQNTTGDDLWVCLQEFADFNIKDMMDSWIMQPGFPLIDGKKQQRFFADGSTDQTTWVLPKITDDMSGHYLIKLSEVDFQQKIRDFKDLSFEQKLRLLIDRSLLMRTPYINTSSILDLLMEFKQEKQESIWQIIVTIIANLKIFFPPTSEYFPLFQKYLFSLASYNIRRLGLKSDSDTADDLKLRPLVLNFAIYAEDQGIMSKLAALYDQKIGEVMNFAKVSPELLDTVVDAKYRFSKEAIFDHLLNRYQNEASPVYKSIILEALASSRNQNHIEKLIALLENQDIIRLQDHVSFLASLLSNHWSKQLVLTWFYNHWNYIKEITKNKSIDDYVRIVGARVSNQIEAKQFREFCDQERSNPAVARAIKIAEYGIKITLEWQKREFDNIYKKIQTV
jgi:membrane alanyl aminopeptidase